MKLLQLEEMMDFDSLVIADWPRGLNLAQKRVAQGKKTAYLEISPYLKQPFPLFMSELKEKVFLESLGFLSQQADGLCCMHSDGVLFLKDKLHNLYKKEKRDVFKSTGLNHTRLNQSHLKEELLAYLGRNLAGRVFKFNDSHLSQEELPIVSDLFFFEPSLRKKNDFEKNNPQIQFFKTGLESFQKKTNTCLTENKKSFPKKAKTSLKASFYLQQDHLNRIHNQLEALDISAKNIFCLSDRLMHFILPQKASFQWQACFFKADLGGYELSIPQHFLIIKQLLFPWCYDNLMSVFQRKGLLEVWMRLAVDKDSSEFVKKAQKNLESFFPGARFQLAKHEPLKSFYVYEEDFVSSATPPFCYLQNSTDFFQGSLMEDLKNEREQKLSWNCF